MKTRRILTGVGVAAALLVGPATMASAYEGDGYQVKVSVSTQTVGGSITVTVDVPNGVKNVRIKIVFPTLNNSDIIVQGVKEVVRPVVNGRVAVSFSTSRSAKGWIEVFDADSGKQIGGQIPVEFLAPTSEASGLPMTGSDVGPLAIGAGVLLAGGAAVAAASRRRRIA